MYTHFIHVLERLPSNSIDIKCSPTVEDAFHLFETFSFGLFDEEEDNNRHDDVERGVEQEDVAAPCVHHVASHQGEKEVEEPLC
jgi:hypothetical protein